MSHSNQREDWTVQTKSVYFKNASILCLVLFFIIESREHCLLYTKSLTVFVTKRLFRFGVEEVTLSYLFNDNKTEHKTCLTDGYTPNHRGRSLSMGYSSSSISPRRLHIYLLFATSTHLKKPKLFSGQKERFVRSFFNEGYGERGLPPFFRHPQPGKSGNLRRLRCGWNHRCQHSLHIFEKFWAGCGILYSSPF
jgi:hypothetical protein